MFRIYHYLDAVWRERSFSKAAQKLYISQAALSIAIRNYESEIGIQIFDRSTLPIQLTDVGEKYMEDVQKILEIEGELASYVDDVKELKAGRLTIGAVNLFASHLLPTFISEFAKRYPHVEISLKEMDMMTLQNLILSGELDIMIESSEFDGSLYSTIPLCQEYILLAVPLSDPVNRTLKKYSLSVEDILLDRHIDQSFPFVPLGMFRNHRFIALGEEHDMRKRLVRACINSGFEPDICMVLNQLMTAYNMVDKQFAITFVSDTIVKLSRERKDIVFYKIKDDQPVRNINIVFKKNRYMSKAMKEFIELIGSMNKQGVNKFMLN